MEQPLRDIQQYIQQLMTTDPQELLEQLRQGSIRLTREINNRVQSTLRYCLEFLDWHTDLQKREEELRRREADLQRREAELHREEKKTQRKT